MISSLVITSTVKKVDNHTSRFILINYCKIQQSPSRQKFFSKQELIRFIIRYNQQICQIS